MRKGTHVSVHAHASLGSPRMLSGRAGETYISALDARACSRLFIGLRAAAAAAQRQCYIERSVSGGKNEERDDASSKVERER